MTDIVDRMKNYIHGEHDDYIPEVLQLACSEIERLRSFDSNAEPTFEQIEKSAKAMFGYNAISQMQMPRWDAIDQAERNHWMALSKAALLPVFARHVREDVEKTDGSAS